MALDIKLKTNKPIDRSRIISVVFIGSAALFSIFFILLTLGYVFFDRHHFLDRLIFSFCTLLYIGLIAWQIKHSHTNLAAKLLVMLYGFIATVMIVLWGINTPVGILLYCFVILLSSVLLGSRYILPVTSLIILTLLTTQLLTTFGIINSELSQYIQDATFIDTLTYSLILCVFALLGWLYGTQIEQLLERLTAINKTISDELNEEKIRLRQAQVDELNSVYKFAELGESATLLIHDLANQLTQLSFELEDADIDKAKITLKRTTSLIHNSSKVLTSDYVLFQPVLEVLNLVDEQRSLFKSKYIRIKVSLPKERYTILADGNPMLFRHVLKNLINNAAQAYDHKSHKFKNAVNVSVRNEESKLIVCVQDFGIGIDKEKRRSLFSAGISTKEGGHGIGLFISRKIMSHHFKGSLTLSQDIRSTCFIISLPIIKQR